MNILCWLFGCKWRFAYKCGDDGIVREGYHHVYVMCPRCGAICDTMTAYIGKDGGIYEDPEHAQQEMERE